MWGKLSMGLVPASQSSLAVKFVCSYYSAMQAAKLRAPKRTHVLRVKDIRIAEKEDLKESSATEERTQ